MKVQAIVQFSDRENGFNTRPIRSCLYLGKKGTEKNQSTISLVVCTSSNRTGLSYRLHKNVLNVFKKFLDQGKCSIQLINPPKTVVISGADALQLKCLVNSIGQIAMTGEHDEKKASCISDKPDSKLASRYFTKPTTRLTIAKKQDYPITKSFPHTLEELRIQGINLKRFDSRILNLSKLVILDLSSNRVSKLNVSLGPLKVLQELNLSGNFLYHIPSQFLATLPKSLAVLNLSNNKLQMIPDKICRTRNLSTLDLRNNDLRRLPFTIGRLAGLKRLDVGGNTELRILPGCISRLKLDHISLSTSCLYGLPNEVSSTVNSCSVVPSLVDICFKACYPILVSRQPLTADWMPIHLIDQWDSLQICQCGKACMWSSCVQSITKLEITATTVVVDGPSYGSKRQIRSHSVFCSSACSSIALPKF